MPKNPPSPTSSPYLPTQELYISSTVLPSFLFIPEKTFNIRQKIAVLLLGNDTDRVICAANLPTTETYDVYPANLEAVCSYGSKQDTNRYLDKYQSAPPITADILSRSVILWFGKDVEELKIILCIFGFGQNLNDFYGKTYKTMATGSLVEVPDLAKLTSITPVTVDKTKATQIVSGIIDRLIAFNSPHIEDKIEDEEELNADTTTRRSSLVTNL